MAPGLNRLGNHHLKQSKVNTYLNLKFMYSTVELFSTLI